MNRTDPGGMDPPRPDGPARPPVPESGGTSVPPNPAESPQPTGTPVPGPPVTPRPQLVCPFGTAYIVCPPNPCPGKDPFFAGGYAEGWAGTGSAGFSIFWQEGGEIVYDFATMERAKFKFVGVPPEDVEEDAIFKGVTTALLEGAISWYAINLDLFESHKDFYQEYGGRFSSITLGLGTPFGEAGKGVIYVYSEEVSGIGKFGFLGLGASPLPVSASWSFTTYTMDEPDGPFRYGTAEKVTRQEIDDMRNHILTGSFRPPHPFTTDKIFDLIERRNKAVFELEKVWQQVYKCR